MRICLDCGSDEIVKNCVTNEIFCFDCKSMMVSNKVND